MIQLNEEGVIFMGVKRKSAIGLKLDDRYVAILDIAVEKMKADGILSASKTDIIRQALEIYAREKQITNENISDNLHNSKQSVANTELNDPNFSTAKSLLKYSGCWVGPKEEIKEIIKYIEDSRTDAEF